MKVLGIVLVTGSVVAATPIYTQKQPVTDEYHGVKVVDDYRWLESDDGEVSKWSDAQNTRARGYLDALPAVKEIRARVTEIVKSSSTDYGDLEVRGQTLFALKADPAKNQEILVALKSADDVASERVVLDPNELDPSGHTAMDFYVPSRDGSKVAVSLSAGGSESGSVHVYDAATGKDTGDFVAHVNGGTAGGSLTWNAEGTGFWYTRYPRADERPPADLDFYQQIWFHKLGTPCAEDKYSLGRDFPRIAEVALSSSDDGRFTVARVGNGDGGEAMYYVLGATDKWVRVAGYADKIAGARFGRDGSLFLLSRKDAPRGKILQLPPTLTNLAHAKVVVPQGDGVIESFLPTDGKLYLVTMFGGPSKLEALDLADQKRTEVATLPVSAVEGLASLGGDDLLFRNESFIDPPAWMKLDAKTGQVAKTALFRTAPVDMSAYEVVREEAVSKDGTKVPMSIVRKKGLKLDGKNPVLLTAYGGYGINMSPHFIARWAPLLEQGGVFVEANIRGGGEFGEAWHLGGNLLNKQKDYDDFYAAEQHLCEAQYTNPKKLAILGGSNGGLLMGVMLTQHPEMVGAVIAQVGIFDMLRVELDANGAFNVTEFGTVTKKDEFNALFAYSPYHHVVDKTAYPSVLMTTGANDPRVAPYHSRKMTARLQAASSSRKPVLLRVNKNAGHGIGTSLADQIDERVDVLAFVFHELDVTYKAPAKLAGAGAKVK